VSAEMDPEMGPEIDDELEGAVEARLRLVAHELLSPLVVAQGYAKLLGEEVGDGGEASELAVGVASNLEHAVLLIQRLRDTGARPDELQLDPARLDLGELVARTVTDLAVTVADRHPVASHVPDEAVWVEADHTRVRQILFNLIVNAAKYSKDGAPIEITLTREECAVLEVRNHGFGVAPDDAERLFQRGVRGNGSGPDGLGIGLYLSRLIAEAHGGSLHVEPAEVRGSRFILQLPLA
jgi:signal transduction histidine kinase